MIFEENMFIPIGPIFHALFAVDCNFNKLSKSGTCGLNTVQISNLCLSSNAKVHLLGPSGQKSVNGGIFELVGFMILLEKIQSVSKSCYMKNLKFFMECQRDVTEWVATEMKVAFGKVYELKTGVENKTWNTSWSKFNDGVVMHFASKSVTRKE